MNRNPDNRRRLQEVGKNILAICLGLVVAFTILEITLRVVEPVQYRIRGNKIILPRHKKYVFENDHKIAKLDKVIHYSRNGLGFRGAPPPEDFAHTLKILTVGGSTTECVLISDGKTWSDILARELKQDFQPLWLNNAGLDGQSTYGHLVLMADYLIKLKPNVVLFLVGANDRSLTDYNPSDKKSLTSFTPRTSLLDTLAQHSEVMNFFLNFYRYSKARQSGLVHTSINFAKLKTIDVTPAKRAKILAMHRQHYLKPYAHRLQELIDLARGNDMEPVFITQPMVYGNVIDPVTGVNLGRVDIGGINGETTWQIMQLYNGVLKAVARRNHVFLIDLATEMPKNTRYFYDTYHFTNAGCRLVGDIVCRHLAPFLAQKFPRYARKEYRLKNYHLTGLEGKNAPRPPGSP